MSISLTALTADSVLKAIARYDELGQEAFFDEYHFSNALEYFLLYGGNAYDSKAIAGVAHGYVTGMFKESGDFSGGAPIANRLRELGFEVTGGSDWVWDEIVLACDIVASNDWQTVPESDPRVIALSSFLRAQDNGRFSDRFRSTGSVHRKLEDLRTARPGYPGSVTRGGRTTRQVAEAFATDYEAMHRIAAELWRHGNLARPDFDDADESAADEPEGDTAAGYVKAIEGRVVQRLVKTRERDPKLRRAKIEAVRKAQGSIACETCGFDFGKAFGSLGEGYIHVHHVVPLHFTNETETSLADLILLCANCHVMIHRRSPWKTPDQLREVLKNGTS